MAKSKRNSLAAFPDCAGASMGDQIDALHRLLEIATFHHAEADGIGDSTIRPKGHMWLVAKVATRLRRLPRNNESLQLHSSLYLGLASGVLWIVEGRDATGDSFVEQAIWWTLADQATLRPIRVDGTLRGDAEDRIMTKALLADWFLDDPLPIEFHRIASRRVEASAIDQNQHVHNTTYLKYLFEAIPLVPRAYQIAYLHPLYVNDVVEIWEYRQDNRIFIRGLVASSTQSVPAFIAAMTVNS